MEPVLYAYLQTIGMQIHKLVQSVLPTHITILQWVVANSAQRMLLSGTELNALAVLWELISIFHPESAFHVLLALCLI